MHSARGVAGCLSAFAWTFAPIHAVENLADYFQSGVMGGCPIGHGGWRVLISCPAILAGSWSCVDHAATLAGAQSFWKIWWRWGEDYPGVEVSSPRP